MLPPRLQLPLLLAICLAPFSLLGVAVAQPRMPAPIQIRQLPVESPTPAEAPGSRAYPTPQMQAVLEQPQKPARNADAPIEQIQTWVRELDADVYAARKEATVELTAVGNRMVEPLVKEMMERGSLEQRTRGFDILNQQATSGNIHDESAAYEALRKLALSEDRALNRRAGQSLASIDTIYQGRALRRLQARGAIVSNYGASQQVNFMARGIAAGEIRNGWSQIVFNDKWQGDASDLEMLRFVPDIRHIELKGEAIDDRFPAAIAHCQTLRVLRIRKSSITDEGFAKLAGMTELRELDVRYTKITESSLPVLNTMKLTRIILIGTRIPPAAITLLASKHLGATIDVRNGGFLGVSERLDTIDGCIINRPEPNSAAEKAGLIHDDKIIKYDGKNVGSFKELRQFIGGNILGDEITLTVLRNGKEMEKKVVLGEWPEDR